MLSPRRRSLEDEACMLLEFLQQLGVLLWVNEGTLRTLIVLDPAACFVRYGGFVIAPHATALSAASCPYVVRCCTHRTATEFICDFKRSDHESESQKHAKRALHSTGDWQRLTKNGR